MDIQDQDKKWWLENIQSPIGGSWVWTDPQYRLFWYLLTRDLLEYYTNCLSLISSKIVVITTTWRQNDILKREIGGRCIYAHTSWIQSTWTWGESLSTWPSSLWLENKPHWYLFSYDRPYLQHFWLKPLHINSRQQNHLSATLCWWPHRNRRWLLWHPQPKHTPTTHFWYDWIRRSFSISRS